MPKRSQRNIEKKAASILAPDPDAIAPQIRPRQSEGQSQEGGPKVVGPAPYDSDDVAQVEKNNIDYTIKVNAFPYWGKLEQLVIRRINYVSLF